MPSTQWLLPSVLLQQVLNTALLFRALMSICSQPCMNISGTVSVARNENFNKLRAGYLFPEVRPVLLPTGESTNYQLAAGLVPQDNRQRCYS